MKPIAIINNIEHLDNILEKAVELKKLALKALPMTRELAIKKSGFFLIHSDVETAEAEYKPLIETLKEIEQIVNSLQIPNITLHTIDENEKSTA